MNQDTFATKSAASSQKNTFRTTPASQQPEQTPSAKKNSKFNAFLEKAQAAYDRFMASLHVVRCIACFTSVFSTLAFLVMVMDGALGLIGLFGLVGIVSMLLACPIKILGMIGKFTLTGFTIGLFFVGIGCIIGAAIGLAVGFLVAIYFPAFVAIPYYFRELRWKV